MSCEVPSAIEALGADFVRLWHEFTVFPTREEVFKKIPVFKPRTLANLDSQGKGPAGRMMIGPKVCYPKEEVILWFASQAKKL